MGVGHGGKVEKPEISALWQSRLSKQQPDGRIFEDLPYNILITRTGGCLGRMVRAYGINPSRWSYIYCFTCQNALLYSIYFDINYFTVNPFYYLCARSERLEGM